MWLARFPLKSQENPPASRVFRHSGIAVAFNLGYPQVGQCPGILIGPQRRDTGILARLCGETSYKPTSGPRR
jgi:hypothetical protein